MPTMFCPGCGKSLSAEEKAKGFCPGCGKPLSGSQQAAPPPRPAPRPLPETPHLGEETAGVTPSILGWGTVRAGLGQIVVGAIISSLSALVAYAVKMTAVEGEGTSALPVVVLWFCLGSGLVGVVVMLAGVFLGCGVPEESGARLWAFTASALLILVFILGGIFLLGELQLRERQEAVERNIFVGSRPAPVAPTWTPDEVKMVAYFGCAAVVLAQVCYLLFLRAVASFFHRDGLALGIVCYLVFNLLVLAGLLLMATGALDLGSLPIRGMGPLYLFIALGVTLGVWGVLLVGQVRGAVTRGMLKS
jgi:hypothetical protein